ncbi:UDPGP type 1 family protein [soil metagenome]
MINRLLAARIKTAGQEHLLGVAAGLSAPGLAMYEQQLSAVEWERVPGWVAEYVTGKPAAAVAEGAEIEPVKHYPADPRSEAGRGPWERERYRALGIELINRGKVAAFTVAGGQGSRLGFEGPKGCYPAGAVTGKPLFACLAEWIVAAERRWRTGKTMGEGGAIPWYIMTSPLNHAATVEFFEANSFFGMDARDVMFFPQGVMPSFDMRTGKMLLSGPGELAVNPDGHGGSIRALHASGALKDMRRRGVEQISYTQIDNPLVRVIDPVFLGLHVHAPESSGEMSSKMVSKAHAGEKVGVFASAAGKVQVIEYSDMPRALTEATDERGGLKFGAGSIAVHALSVEFVERLATGGGSGEGAGARLAFHRAEKKVPYFDLETNARVEPTENNAVKLEAFVFDALLSARGTVVLETPRMEEFAPIKNATGADSPATCSAMQTERAAGWIESAGGTVPRDVAGKAECMLEVSPLTALDAAELREKFGRAGPPKIERGAKVAL